MDEEEEEKKRMKRREEKKKGVGWRARVVVRERASE